VNRLCWQRSIFALPVQLWTVARRRQCVRAYVVFGQDDEQRKRGSERPAIQHGGLRDRRAILAGTERREHVRAGVAWLDTKTHALLDVFVMNVKTHVVFDYAPGSLHPESSGTIKIVKAGKPLPS
jgi:hypothetical protein